MAKTIRVVFAGCGGISGAWMNSLKTIPGVEVVGLMDIRAEAAEKRKAEFGYETARVGTDLNAILKATKPDAVFDCTIPEAHYATTLTALKHGCHVLGEKPLADSMEHAKKMVAAAKKARRIYAITQTRRYNKNIRAFSGLLAGGKLGKLTTLNSDFYIGAHFGGFRDRMKHVLLLDMAIHSFDAARFISDADPVSVFCKEWNPKGSWYDHDASAMCMFEMSDGIFYTYRGSWCAEGLNTSWECEWRAVCTKGSATWNGVETFKAAQVKKTGGFFSEFTARPVPVSDTAKDGGHQGVIADFIECLRKGKTPETTCTDNIKSLAMVFGAIESAETGKTVKINM